MKQWCPYFLSLGLLLHTLRPKLGMILHSSSVFLHLVERVNQVVSRSVILLDLLLEHLFERLSFLLRPLVSQDEHPRVHLVRYVTCLAIYALNLRFDMFNLVLNLLRRHVVFIHNCLLFQSDQLNNPISLFGHYLFSQT